MEKTTLIISAMIVLIVILLIMNYVKTNQIYALEERDPTEQMEGNINSTKDKLTLYYTDWCGISTRFRPTWDTLAKNTGLNVSMEVIDCVKNDQVCKLNAIRGYPTIILHKNNGQNIIYNGSRTLIDLENFVKKNSP